MKNGKRIAALALSMVIALGSVCYRPPKAEAAIVGSALASAAISTYLSATGFEFFGGGPSSPSEMNELLAKELTKLTQEFAASIDQLNDEVTTVITSGVTMLENGVVKFSAASANMLGRFEDWLIDKLGLASSDGVSSGNNVVFVPGTKDGFVNCGGAIVPAFPVYDESVYPYMYLVYNRSAKTYYFTVSSKPGEAHNAGSQILALLLMREYKLATTGTWQLTRSGDAGVWVHDSSVSDFIWSNHNICFSDGAVGYLGSAVGVARDDDNPVVSVSLSVDYEPAPTIDDQYAMVVDTGLSFADEQSYIDAVLNGISAGTLSPTYTIEQATTGDVVVPDEDEERVGILNWVKHIAQSVKELPQSIADAVADVFVPSAEYMAVVPETIAGTFGSRTGFLTYPTSVLYDFVDMLSDGSGDFILSWPSVREPSTGGVMMEAGQFNVSKFVRDNQTLSDWYVIYQYAVGAYLTFLFFGLCRRKYNSVVGDRLGG